MQPHGWPPQPPQPPQPSQPPRNFLLQPNNAFSPLPQGSMAAWQQQMSLPGIAPSMSLPGITPSMFNYPGVVLPSVAPAAPTAMNLPWLSPQAAAPGATGGTGAAGAVPGGHLGGFLPGGSALGASSQTPSAGPSISPPPHAPPPQAPAPAPEAWPGPNRVTIQNESQEREHLAKLYEYIKELGGELEPGYTVEIKKRLTGNCAGSVDVYFHSPAGKRFRSKQEIAKSLGLAVPGPSSAGGKGTKGGGSSSSRMPRDQAAAAAREQAASQGALLPLQLEGGVTVEDLGRLHPTQPGHHTRTALYPEGYTASREAPIGDTADPDSPTRTGSFMSSIAHANGAPVFAVHLVPPGRRREDRVELATAADPSVVWQKVWDEQQTGLIAVRAATAAAKVQEEQGLQQQQQEQQGATPTPSKQGEQQQGGMSGAGGGGIPASTALAVAAAVALLPVAQQWLVKVLPMEEPPWGLAEFAFNDMQLLQLLEALEGVEECTEYQYVITRPGGWDAEERALGRAAEKHSKDASKAVSKAGVAMERGVNKVQAFALKHAKRVVAHASKKGQPPAALTAVEEQQLHGPLMVAAQATGLMPTGMHASPLTQQHQQQEGEPMGYLASIIAQGRVGGEEVRVRDSIARILDKMITKIEIQERREKERADMQASRGPTSVAAAAHPPSSGSPSHAPPAPGSTTEGAAPSQRPAHTAPPPPPPEPLQHALARGILAAVLKQGRQGSGNAGEGEGAGVGDGTAGRQDEQEALQQLGSMVLELKEEDMDRLLQVWDFVAHMPHLVGLDSPPSLLDLLTTILLPPQPPFASKVSQGDPVPDQRRESGVPGAGTTETSGLAGRSSAAELGERLHAGLVRLLLGEAYEATSTYLMGTIPLPVNKRDTGMGAPRVTGATWPEAARRYLSAAATAAYLSMAPGRPSSLMTQPLAGTLSCLGVHDWLAYLTAGFNAVPSSFQAIEEAGRAEVAARGGLYMPPLPSPTAGHRHVAHAVKQEHAGSPALAAESCAMDVDGAHSTAAAVAAEAGGNGAQCGAVQAGDGCAPSCAVPALLAAAEAAGLPSRAPGALAGLAADEGVVSGPFLGSSISSGGVHGPGALVSRVALLPAPQHGSRTAAEALLNLEDSRAVAAAERLLQHHRLSTSTSHTATQARTQPASAQALPQATHTGGPLTAATPSHAEAAQTTAIGLLPSSGPQPPAPAAAPPAPAAPTEFHTLPGATGPSEAPATGASPAAAPIASAGTKIKFKLKGKLGSNSAKGASPSPAAHPPAATPAASGASAGAHGHAHAHAAPKFALHNEDPPYEACLSVEERALAEQHDVRCGRVLLDTLMNVTAKKGGTGRQMEFCAHALRSLSKAPRGLDLHAVAARLDAGLYQSTGCTASAMAADIVACCTLWRTTALKMAHHGADKAEKMLPYGFDRGGTDLADEVEAKLAQLLPRFRHLAAESEHQQNKQQRQQQQQQQQQKQDGKGPRGEAAKLPPGTEATKQVSGPEAVKIEAPHEVKQEPREAGTQESAAGALAVAVKQDPDLGAWQEKKDLSAAGGGRQQAQAAAAAATAAEEVKDLKALRDCRRVYAPAGEGCRVCWRSEDPTKLILCDGCDDEYHCYCAFPPLEDVPEGQWFCPLCASKAGRPNPPDRHQQRQEALERAGDLALPPLPPAPPAPQLLPPPGHEQQHQQQQGEQEKKERAEEQHHHEEGDGGQQETVPPELRSGMEHLKRLLRLADALGHWAGEAPASVSQKQGWHTEEPKAHSAQHPHQREGQLQQHHPLTAAAAAAQLHRWGPSQRIDLLHALVELSADCGAVHAAIDVVEETRKEAKKQAQAIKSKARKFAADAAAAESGVAQPPPPPGARPARFKPQDKAALSSGEVALLTLLEDQGERLSIRRQCLGIDRLGNKYWWVGDPGPPAILPQEKTAAATLASRPTPFSGFVAVEQPLQQDSLKREQAKEVGPPASCPSTPGPEDEELEEEAGATGAAAGADKDDVGVPMRWGAYTSATSLAPVVPFAEGNLRTALQRAKDAMARAEAHGITIASAETGGLVASAAAAGAGAPDTGTMSPSAHATGPPRTLPSSGEAAAGGAAQLSAAVAGSGAHMGTSATGHTPAASAPPSPSPMASPAPLHHFSWGSGQVVAPGTSRAGSERLLTGSRLGARPSSHQQQELHLLPSLLRCSTAAPAFQHVLTAAAAAAVAAPAAGFGGAGSCAKDVLSEPEFAAAASVLRGELLGLFDALPAEAFRANSFWGSKERQAQWRDFVSRCPPTPSHFSAAITLLENMIADDQLRPHWRWWSQPAQHPAAVTSLNTVWYRLAGLHGAFKYHPHGAALPTRSALGMAALAPGAPLVPPIPAPRGASAAVGAPPAAPAAPQPPAKGAAQARGQKRAGEGQQGGRQRQRTAASAQDWDYDYQDPEEQRAEYQKQQQQQLEQQRQQHQQEQQWLEEMEEQEEEDANAGQDGDEEVDEDVKRKDEEEDYNPFADSSAGEPEEEEPEGPTHASRSRRRSSQAAAAAPSRARKNSRSGAAKRPASKLPTTRAGRLELQLRKRAEREQQQQLKQQQQQGVAPVPPPPAPSRPLRPPSTRKRLRTNIAAVSPLASEDSEYAGDGSVGGSGDAELEDEDVDMPPPPPPTRSSTRSTRGMRVPAPPPPPYIPAPPPAASVRVPQPPVSGHPPPMPPMPPAPQRQKKPKYSEDSFFDDL